METQSKFIPTQTKFATFTALWAVRAEAPFITLRQKKHFHKSQKQAQQ